MFFWGLANEAVNKPFPFGVHTLVWTANEARQVCSASAKEKGETQAGQWLLPAGVRSVAREGVAWRCRPVAPTGLFGEPI